jgi:pimeloyl-ACP methyl ester carboxylesterase
MHYVFTLVHGTWGRGWWPLRLLESEAPWTNECSPLCKAIRKRFKNASIERVPWSGGNTFRARANGAKYLARELDALMSRYKDSRHIIVAHSHGGTVAVNALRDEQLANRVMGLVSLSTPFPLLKLRMRREDALWPVMSLGSLLGGFIGWRQDLTNITYFNLIAGSGIGAALGMLAAGLLPVKFYLRRAEIFAARHSCPTERKYRLLVVRAPGDEAGGLLSAAHFVGWLSSRSIDATIVVAGAGFVLSVAAAVYYRQYSAFGGGVFLIVGLTGLLQLVPYAIGLLAILPFDPTAAVYAPALSISAEVAPPGYCELSMMRVGDGFQHRRPYEDPSAIVTMCDWIESMTPKAE